MTSFRFNEAARLTIYVVTPPSLPLPARHFVVYRAVGHMALVSRNSNGAARVDPLVSARMRAVRQKNTAVEIAVRAISPLPRTPLPSVPHGSAGSTRHCESPPSLGRVRARMFLARASRLSIGSRAKTNVEFWSEKIAGNRARRAVSVDRGSRVEADVSHHPLAEARFRCEGGQGVTHHLGCTGPR